jgi:hypothetical protein
LDIKMIKLLHKIHNKIIHKLRKIKYKITEKII